MARVRRSAAWISVAVATVLVACAAPPGAERDQARTDLFSSATIVSRALALRENGVVSGTYVRVAARQNAATAAAAADRLQKLGAPDLAARGHVLATTLDALGRDDRAAAAADLESLRAAFATHGAG